MQIARQVGELSWGDVSGLRRAMSKSAGAAVMDQYGAKWKAGAARTGLSSAAADKGWADLCSFGAYGFNRAHAVSYALQTYWCCYLKAHFRMEYAAASLQHEACPERQLVHLREMAAEGVEYIAIDPELSTDRWCIGTAPSGARRLVGPVSNVKGIGAVLLAKITAARAAGTPLPPRAVKLLADPVTPLDVLWPIKHRVAQFPDPKLRNAPANAIRSVLESEENGEVLFFCTLAKITPIDENAPRQVEKRGHHIQDSLTTALTLILTDDSGEIWGKIDRFNFARIGSDIAQHGKVGKTLYAVLGITWGTPAFRGVRIDDVRRLGEL